MRVHRKQVMGAVGAIALTAGVVEHRPRRVRSGGTVAGRRRRDQRGLRRRRQQRRHVQQRLHRAGTTRPPPPVDVSTAGPCSTRRRRAAAWQVTALTGTMPAGGVLRRRARRPARAARRRRDRRRRPARIAMSGTAGKVALVNIHDRPDLRPCRLRRLLRAAAGRRLRRLRRRPTTSPGSGAGARHRANTTSVTRNSHAHQHGEQRGRLHRRHPDARAPRRRPRARSPPDRRRRPSPRSRAPAPPRRSSARTSRRRVSSPPPTRPAASTATSSRPPGTGGASRPRHPHAPPTAIFVFRPAARPSTRSRSATTSQVTGAVERVQRAHRDHRRARGRHRRCCRRGVQPRAGRSPSPWPTHRRQRESLESMLFQPHRRLHGHEHLRHQPVRRGRPGVGHHPLLQPTEVGAPGHAEAAAVVADNAARARHPRRRRVDQLPVARADPCPDPAVRLATPTPVRVGAAGDLHRSR